MLAHSTLPFLTAFFFICSSSVKANAAGTDECGYMTQVTSFHPLTEFFCLCSFFCSTCHTDTQKAVVDLI